MRVKVELGGTYGYWTTLERVAGTKFHSPKWVCRCVCGTVKTVAAGSLASSSSQSCGCSRIPNAKIGNKKSRTPLGVVWRNMMARCYRPDNENFNYYGGRGISVYLPWHDFETFEKAVGPHPGKGFSLDRIDNDKGYFPENVKWSTLAEQGRNKRSNVLIEFRGKSMCQKDWASELGVTNSHLYERRLKGLTGTEAIEDILKNPPKKTTNVVVTFQGKSQNLTRWAEEFDVDRNTLIFRHAKGLSWPEVIADILKNPPRPYGKKRKGVTQ